MSPILLALLALLASLIGGFAAGHHAASAECRAATAAASQAAQAAQRKLQEQYQQAADSLSNLQIRQHETAIENTQAVERIVVRPVYRNVCLDADGLRLANRALAGSADSAQPVGTLPSP